MVTTTTTPDKLALIMAYAELVAHVPGCFAEAGVYQGATVAALADRFPSRTIFGFDTFKGLPAEAWQEGEPHNIGDFGDNSPDLAYKHIAERENVILVPGVFPASARNWETFQFALVHIDFDFYKSTRDAIEWFLPRMSNSGVIIFDDYDWRYCPGVKQAIDEAELSVRPVGYQAIHVVAK